MTITSLSDNVFGTLAGDTDCHVGTVLAPKQLLQFHDHELHLWRLPRQPHQHLYGGGSKQCWRDRHGNDDATVTFTNVMPTVDLTKSVTPLTLPEPGGTFNYTLTIHNTSTEVVTITALTDTNALSAECTALIGTSIPAGGTVSCTYQVSHTAVGSYPNTASVTVKDNENDLASDSDTKTVTVTDIPPTVDLTKSVTPLTLPEPGGTFNYTLTIHNTSTEAVTITALTDTNALSAECQALVGTTLAAGGIGLVHLHDHLHGGWNLSEHSIRNSDR